jgi:hypothetical protein
MRRLPFLSLIAACFFVMSSCGGDGCGSTSKLLNEPGCKNLGLVGKRIFSGASAACGSAGSRKSQIKCPGTAGSAGQCGAGSTGAAVVSILLPSSQATFATCQDVIAAYGGGSLTGVAGIFVSTVGDSTTTVDCSSGSCLLTSPTCYAAWDDSTFGPASSAANLTNNTAYSYCTYIDTANFNGLTSITAGGASSLNWASPLPSVTTGIAGVNVLFDASSNWVDAY